MRGSIGLATLRRSGHGLTPSAFDRIGPSCDAFRTLNALVAEIGRQLQRDASCWADDAHVQRVADGLANRAVPVWLIRTLQRLSGRAA